MSQKPCAVVFGVGPKEGIGGATALRFAAGGVPVFAAGRRPEKIEEVVAAADGAEIVATEADGTDPASVVSVFDEVERAGYVPGFVLHNIGGNWPMATLDATPDFIETMWRSTCFSGFLVGAEAIRRMLPQGNGTLVFTGASASMRGKPNFAAFAAAKAGLRAFAQSCAREFGPKGIHVAHVVIDGVVRGERLARLAPQWLEARGEGTVEPEAVGETYWQIHQQPKTAWTHEMELRPFDEQW